MYRPNRIGPYGIFDLDFSQPAWPSEWLSTGTNFDNVDNSVASLPAPHFHVSTVRDDYQQLYWNKQSSQSCSLAASNQIAFGASISGVHENDKPMLYTGSVDVSVTVSETTPYLSGQVFCGKLASATVDVSRVAANNGINTMTLLPCRYYSSQRGMLRFGWEGSFIKADYAANGFGSFPVVLGVSLKNMSGANAVTFLDIQVACHLFRYSKDVDTFEPNR